MLGLYPGVGLSPNINPDDVLVRSIVNNPNYTASVAGTNVATTRATGLLCPFTGTTLGNNVPCRRRIYLGGKAHDAFGAWPQTVNLFTNSDLGGSALAADTGSALNTTTNRGPNSLPAQGFVEDSASSTHSMVTQTISGLSNSTTYTVSVRIKSTGRGFARLTITPASVTGWSPIGINLTTGAASAGVSTALGNGWFRWSFQFTSSGTVGTPQLIFSGATAASYADMETYLGDGISGFDVSGIQIVAGSVSLPLARTNGGTTTVNADLHTMTVSTNQTGAILACAVPIYWSAGAGAAHPSGFAARLFDASGADFLHNSTNDYAQKQDSSTEFVSVPSLSRSASVPLTRAMTFSGSSLSLWRNGSLSGSDTSLSGSWLARSSYMLGSLAGLNRSWCGLVLVGVCNGFIPSDAAMAAWHRSVVRALQPLSVPIL